MDKIVVLNSGGFDSTCLINHVFYTLEKGSDIHSLHFTHGNRNAKQETKCVRKVCKKLGVENHTIKLPKMSWTKGNFYSKGYDVHSQYLEYRNLIFLSYAISFAESIGAKRIYLAILKSHWGYNDTSKEFIRKINSISEQSGIKIITPFSNYDKDNLKKFVIDYGIKVNEYFSCDVPTIFGNRCNKCLDCQDLKSIESDLMVNTPVKRYIISKNLKDKHFMWLEKTEPIKEIRFLLNNKCQLKCKHCFYGFDSMVGKQLDNETLYRALKDSFELGVSHVHFSGKEPLFDDNIFWYTRKFKKEFPEITWSVVTNGINIPKYVNTLKEQGCERVFLSVDDVLDTNGVRTNHTTIKALDSLNESEIPTEIFIDLHEKNKGKISDIIRTLYKKYPRIIKQFYIRTIKPIGNASSFSLLTCEDINNVYEQLKEVSSPNYSIVFSIGIEYVPVISNSPLGHDIEEQNKYFSCIFGDNFTVYLESFCNRYQTQVTLTPDGYLLGCASEVSSSNYDKISVGNITEYSMKSLFKKGKRKLIQCQKENCYRCSFLDETY